jgi:glycosyltransferase involved in cell wall biosynthesis
VSGAEHVTAVMPTTAARRPFIPYAIRWFLAQDWPDCSLLVVGDGDEVVVDLIPDHPRIRYCHLGSQRPLGQKYNECVERARGPWIALWADDDWQAPWKLRVTMTPLLGSGKQIAGTREMLFHRIGTDRTWRYSRYDDDPYFLGGSLVFHKDYWRDHSFDSGAAHRADAAFTNSISRAEYAEKALVLRHPLALRAYVATIHPGCTGRAPGDPDGPGWERWAGDLGELMGSAADLYLPGGDIATAIL